jgi:hypothetical protein
MSKPINMIGEKYGKLTVISLCTEKTSGGRRLWLCQCECGNYKKATRSHLQNGNTTSCGCVRKAKDKKLGKKLHRHGLYGKRIYTIWQQMKDRCYNKNNKDYTRYGGRGITVCDEWKTDAKAFSDWANANGYSDNLTLDRIDVNGNYEPSNCRWATIKQQDRNRTNTIYITFNGETKPLAEWCEIRGIRYGTAQKRYYQGHSPEIVLSKEILKNGERFTKTNPR